MTQLIIDTGAAPNDGTGDPLRTAFTKVNYDFTAVYDAGPVGSNIQITDNRIITINTNGNLVLAPNGIGNVVSNVNILPNMSNIRSLGSSAYRWDSTYTRYLDAGSANITSVNIGNANIGNISTITIDVANIHILGGTNGYVLQTDGTGNLTWTAQTGGSGNGTPGGANTQIQYNDAGTFGGTAGFTFDNVANVLNVPGNVSAGNVLTSEMIIANGEIQSGTGFFTGGYLSVNGNTDLANANLSGAITMTATPSGPSNQIKYGTGNLVSWLDGQWTIGEYNGNTYGTQGIRISPGIEGNVEVILPSDAAATTDPLQLNNYAGNVQIIANGNTWTFGNDGNLTVPGGILGGGNLKLSPDSTNAGSYLDIFLTSGPDLHLVASAGANLILGKDDGANVLVSWDGNAYIQSWNLNTGNVGGIWTFGGDGNLTLPNTTGNINYSNGVNILNDITTTGNFAFNSYSFDGTNFDEIALTGTNSGNILVNADGLIAVLGGYESSGMIADAGNAYIFNSDPTFVDGIPQLGVGYIWQFDNGANLILAPTNQEINGAGSGEAAKFRGTRKIVNGYTNSYAYSTVLAAGGTPTIAYTATDNSVMSVKVTFAVEGANGVWEQFDVSAVIDSTGNDVNFTVSNRVKRDLAIADTVVTAAMDGSDRITISLNLDASQSAGWSSFDAVEFGLMVG